MVKSLRYLMLTLILVCSAGAGRASAQDVWLGYPNISSEVFDYLEPIYLSYGGAWDLWWNCDTVQATYVDLWIEGDDGWYASDYLFPGETYWSWEWGWFEDCIPGYFMWETTYSAALTVTYHDYNWEMDYNVPAYSTATVYPLFQQWCDDPDKSRLIDQYHRPGISPIPDCSKVHKSLGATYDYVTWSNIANAPAANGSSDNDLFNCCNQVGIVSSIMASDIDLLLYYYVNYSGPGQARITSGFRTPNRNPGATNSNHIHGQATDVNVQGWLDTSNHGVQADQQIYNAGGNPSVAYAIWLDLRQTAMSLGAESYEDWPAMWNSLGHGDNDLNHMHANYPWLN